MATSSDIIFETPRSQRAIVVLVTLPGELLFAFIGIESFGSTPGAGVAFIGASIALAVWMIFEVTTRVYLSEHALTRNWLWGSSVVPIKEIARLEWSSGRGQRFLTIRTKKRFIMLGGLSLSPKDLGAIERRILESLGLSDSPRLPRYANYLDIPEMIKHRTL